MIEPTLQNSDITSDLLELWKICGGYYRCPKSSDGTLLGPLVGYAGKYKDGVTEKNWVGEEYYNYAKVEEHYRAVDAFAEAVVRGCWKPLSTNFPTVVLAAPMGGIVLGQTLARRLNIRFIFAEKKVTKASDGITREESKLTLDRHEVRPEDKVLVVEDVINNFSTTDQIMSLIYGAGAEPLALACALNRSEKTEWHPSANDLSLPVISAVHKPTMQYKQDDRRISHYIEKGQIVWKPKADWGRLAAAMAANA